MARYRTRRELGAMVRALSRSEFRQRVGPFVLAQRPAGLGPSAGRLAEPEGPDGALATAQRDAQDIIALAMLNLLEPGAERLATWPERDRGSVLVVGRLLDSHVVVAHSSVSKRHAVLRWDEARRVATVEDAGSLNGTFVNGAKLGARHLRLYDGDTISFGDVAFDYVLSDSLYAKLQQEPARSEPTGGEAARGATLGAVSLQPRRQGMPMPGAPAPGAASPAVRDPFDGGPPSVPSDPGPPGDAEIFEEETSPGWSSAPGQQQSWQAGPTAAERRSGGAKPVSRRAADDAEPENEIDE